MVNGSGEGGEVRRDASTLLQVAAEARMLLLGVPEST
jgi:hypothetical protein